MGPAYMPGSLGPCSNGHGIKKLPAGLEYRGPALQIIEGALVP